MQVGIASPSSKILMHWCFTTKLRVCQWLHRLEYSSTQNTIISFLFLFKSELEIQESLSKFTTIGQLATEIFS